MWEENVWWSKILIDTGDKIPNGFTLKNVVILMTCVVKDNDKFYLQIFLGELLLEAWKISSIGTF